MAHLGLDRIAILYKDGTEIPSDLHGVLYGSALKKASVKQA